MRDNERLQSTSATRTQMNRTVSLPERQRCQQIRGHGLRKTDNRWQIVSVVAHSPETVMRFG